MHPRWECPLENEIIERIFVRISMLLFIVSMHTHKCSNTGKILSKINLLSDITAFDNPDQ